MKQKKYIGRFAPSPTGPLHYGSLVAASASYLQAKHHQGQWLLRIEDIDPPREIKGTTQDIITTLERYQFQWDQEPMCQSSRLDVYREAIKKLSKQSLVYACSCSRKTLEHNAQKNALGRRYPGTCANKGLSVKNTFNSVRIRVHHQHMHFQDGHFGEQTHNLYNETGDFVIYRKFDLPAYALAVTLDDAFQGITEVVRGQDLLAFTPMQIYLCQQFNLPVPNFFHIPIAVNQQGQKLSKQTKAKAISKGACEKTLLSALGDLGQPVPNYLDTASLSQIWDWAIEHWDAKRIPKTIHIMHQS